MEAHELFEILVRENAKMLIAYIRSVIRDASAADDIFQETMLTAWRRLDVYDKSRPFGPWLRAIASRVLLAHQRKAARGFALYDEATLEYLAGRFETLHQQPGDTFDQKLQGLRDCLASLPGHYKTAIELRYREDLKGHHLAQQLGISLEALKKRLQRGRAMLQDCLVQKLALTTPVAGHELT